MIRVDNLGKCYKRYPSHWSRLAEWASGGRPARHQARWALRGISFAVGAGEALGIVGANGAGKSTLLKILTGTTLPSEGAFQLDGRVAALLELGTGFHPDFTGAQNALIGCQMQGLSTADAERCLPHVADFAELADHMDEPLRSYSTGMQMRLAFSVATAVRPEVLIVDEALSVGDIYFQHKSMQRIRDFRAAGTTLLFVSHDPTAVRTLCDRALLLEHGRVLHSGAPDAVLDFYNARVAQREADAAIVQQPAAGGRVATRSGSRGAEITAVTIAAEDGTPRTAFAIAEPAVLRCAIRFAEPVARPTVGFVIRDRLGNDIFGTNSFHLAVFPADLAAGEILECDFRLVLNLGAGTYSVSAAVHTGETHLERNLDWWDQALVFEVTPSASRRFVGAALLPVALTVRRHLP
ncbi:ABC transporter ATP-binding protein [bacterium]|nr:ABC transporter ATP-binding protein [bacterium]